MSTKIILEGEFQRFAPQTYPSCNNYDKYMWDWGLERWVLNNKWILKERNDKIKKIKCYEKKN